MKAIRKSDRKIVEVEKTVTYNATWRDYERIYDESDLDFNLPEEKAEVIEGWVVRDKRYLSSILAHQTSKLYLCQEKPRRIDSMGFWDRKGEYFKLPNDFSQIFHLGQSL